MERASEEELREGKIDVWCGEIVWFHESKQAVEKRLSGTPGREKQTKSFLLDCFCDYQMEEIDSWVPEVLFLTPILGEGVYTL